MGMSTGGKPGAVKSDINVTPLVDVVLVLLIIFIVTMPVMMHTESLEVPRSADENELPDTSKQVIVTYRPDGTVVLSDGQNSENDKKIQATSLVLEVSDRLKEKTGDKVVFVDFCDHTPWSDVVQTMDEIRSLATDKNHNDIRVALKKREKQSDIRDEQAAGTYKDPCQ